MRTTTLDRPVDPACEKELSTEDLAGALCEVLLAHNVPGGQFRFLTTKDGARRLQFRFPDLAATIKGTMLIHLHLKECCQARVSVNVEHIFPEGTSEAEMFARSAPEIRRVMAELTSELMGTAPPVSDDARPNQPALIMPEPKQTM